MCGVAGEIFWNQSASPERVGAMVRGIRHRGPDDSGIWRSDCGTAALGHARLSIIDLSEAGHQPMLDPYTGNAIVFNGEIYNYQELRTHCIKQGDQFYSNSDTEVILALYRRHGPGMLPYLKGMFALAIWDVGKEELFVARDRVGKKPFNYVLTENGILFCSELQPLATNEIVDQSIDSAALELYLQLGYVPAPWTIYSRVKKLPPAHYAVFSKNGVLLKKYWSVDYRIKTDIPSSELLDAYEEKLTEAVKLRLVSDVPVGALLSGGIDSSLVVAIMAKLSKEPVRTFSIGFQDGNFDESIYSDAVAKQFNTCHYKEVVSADIGGSLENIIKHYGEPYADSSALPSFRVCQNARKHLKVVLNGDGGDELLGGYPRYKLSQPVKMLSGALHGKLPISPMLKSSMDRLSNPTLLNKARYRSIRTLAPQILPSIMYSDFWNDHERSLLVGRKTSVLHDWRLSYVQEAISCSNNAIDSMLYLDNKTYLAGDLLAKMDIASMHCNLESRSPFLDSDLIEFCASLPADCKVYGGEGKYFSKKLAERYFSKEFIYRKKMGFAIPIKTWLRNDLNSISREILSDETLMSPLSMEYIDIVRKEFNEGGGHQSRIWSLLMYGLWKRHCMGV